MLLINKSEKPRDRGFTLVELMVVIAIIAVLAAIAIPVFSRTRENARQTRCRANLHSIAVALRTYMTEWEGFPLPYDPVTGEGGITQLSLSGYLSSTKVLRCPDDSTTVANYNDANGLTGGGNAWDENKFSDRYCSYNQLIGSGVAVTYPIYNFFGYRGAPGTTGAPVGTGPSYTQLRAEVGALPATWPGLSYADSWSVAEQTNFNNLIDAGLLWAGGHSTSPYSPYLDATHHNYYDGRVFDRDMNPADPYGRPLWDTDTVSPTASFPGLYNRNAPDNAIITHCYHHRNWFGGTPTQQKDLCVRLSGDVGLLGLGDYDWVVQKQ
jgi:prepilin-type N-terminal cleavage/methylation domain-containing protein